MVSVDWSARPACPKCGEQLRFGHGETLDERLRRHFENVHAVSIGTAHAAGRDSFRFAYLRPVAGTTEAWWHVLLLDGPALVTKLRVDSWAITWERVTPELSQGRAKLSVVESEGVQR